MARTAVTVTTMTASTFAQRPAGTTADPTNDHVVTIAGPLEEYLFSITQTDASARVATIVAGDNPPALSAGQGDLTQSMAQNEVWEISGLESGRFLQNDGTLHIDLAASFAGTVRAIRIAR
jgi:hypothetical protein